MTSNELQKALDGTKVALMSKANSAFFTTIVFSLKFQWDESIPTAATNGHYLKWNPKWFLSLTKDERVAVMVHEAAHVAYDHMGRLMTRDMRMWNNAADHVINLDLKKQGFTLPGKHLADPRFDSMSTEQVYQILQAEQDDTENPMPDLAPPGSGEDPVDPDSHQRHIENLVIRAATQAKMQQQAGSIPGEIEVFLNKLLAPRLPWKTILRREVNDLAKTAYSWLRPNRRYYPQHFLPSLHSRDVTQLDFYIDISGSVTDEQFNIYVSEIAATMKMFSIQRIRIVQFDTRIRSIDTVKNLRELKAIEFTGRGGTDPECIFEDMLNTKPKLALVFTDGYFNWRRDGLKQRLLWLINDNPGFKPLFGRAVYFDTENKND